LDDREDSVKRTRQVFFPEGEDSEPPVSIPTPSPDGQVPESLREPESLPDGTIGELVETILKASGNWMSIHMLVQEFARRGRTAAYNSVDSALQTRTAKLDIKREGKRKKKLYRMKAGA
jgi:hypothetical protein